MKNLALEKPEKLEELSNHARMRQNDNLARGIRGHYHNRNDYPWKRVWRFIASNIGKNWDEVYSKYCKLDWVPHRFKTTEQIGHTVILNTFCRDGEVWYYTKYSSGESRMSDEYRESFYVHPKNKILCRQVPKRNDRKKEYAIEQAKTMRVLGHYHQLLKLNGIWHEVKGEPVKSDIIEIDGLHYLLSNFKIIRKPYVHGGIEVKTIDFPLGAPTDGNYKIIGEKVYEPYKYHRNDKNKVGPKDRLLEENPKRSLYYGQRKNHDSVKITLCRQLNSKELKKHGIQNDRNIVGIRCKKCGGIAGRDCINHICSACGKYYKEDCKCYPWGN